MTLISKDNTLEHVDLFQTVLHAVSYNGIVLYLPKACGVF